MKNSVQLIGNLGNDAQVKNLEGGKKVANFSIATTETYKNDKGEKQEETQWHSCVAWGKTAEILEKFTSKGSQLGLQGKLIHRSYTDSDGNTKYVTEVLVNEVLLLSSKK